MKEILALFSEFFVNLAASWFGVAVIAPNYFQDIFPQNLVRFTLNLVWCIVCFTLAYVFRAILQYRKEFLYE